MSALPQAHAPLWEGLSQRARRFRVHTHEIVVTVTRAGSVVVSTTHPETIIATGNLHRLHGRRWGAALSRAAALLGIDGLKRRVTRIARELAR